jgi:hypothetical protein
MVVLLELGIDKLDAELDELEGVVDAIVLESRPVELVLTGGVGWVDWP